MSNVIGYLYLLVLTVGQPFGEKLISGQEDCLVIQLFNAVSSFATRVQESEETVNALRKMAEVQGITIGKLENAVVAQNSSLKQQSTDSQVLRMEIKELKELVSNLSHELQSLREEVAVYSTGQLQWIYVNDSKVLPLSSNGRFEANFSTSDYDYDSSEFREVEVNAQAAGDLNANNEYILTYFNSSQIGQQWNTPGVTGGDLRQLDAYPIQKVVEGSSFTLAVYASNHVESGSIKFTLVRFRATRK